MTLERELLERPFGQPVGVDPEAESTAPRRHVGATAGENIGMYRYTLDWSPFSTTRSAVSEASEARSTTHAMPPLNVARCKSREKTLNGRARAVRAAAPGRVVAEAEAAR